ncbi:right-handed parallel beta-helix repeat-containing protein [Kangiella sediminilitoris]|uniref:Right handed beta helix domain-containing protein n=1 Tax=Kangiella sediminilitoris TaxID=1144748 RepID=A0A1B3B8P2_9GAMM|nr:right-handed parallel beta-helix repeat-containing protein [Kangiella sediminilitoris]AOE49140.1 hypothetical protein KS2013_416 [Kangiella sediminilitoris]
MRTFTTLCRTLHIGSYYLKHRLLKAFAPTIILLLLLTPSLGIAATFVVNSTSNEQESFDTIGDGECLTTSGVCTFVAAIVEAEFSPTFDIIDLTNINGTIEVSSFEFEQPLELRGAGVTIQSGNDNLRWRGDGSIISGIEFIGFRSLVLEGENQTFSNNIVRDGAGVSSRNSYSIIEDNRVYNTSSFVAIDVAGSSTGDTNIGSIVRNNIIGFDENDSAATGTSSVGIRAAGSEVLVEGNTSHGFYAGFYLVALSDSTIANNRIGDSNGQSGNGAVVTGGVAGHGIWSINGSNNIYSANAVNGHAVNGILLEGSTGAQLLFNEYSNNGNAGITATQPGNIFERNSLVGNSGLAIDLLNDGIINNINTDNLPNPPSVSVVNDNGTQLLKGQFNDPEFINNELSYCLSVSTSCPSGLSNAEFNLQCINGNSDNSGQGNFSTPALNLIPEGRYITATVTTSSGSSELSSCSQVPPLEPVTEPLEFYSLNAWVLNPRSAKPLLGVFLGSGTNDVTRIDINSLTLGNAPGSVITTSDVNEDGYMDLLVKFSGKQTGARCGDSLLTLNGQIAGDSFEKELQLRMVGCNGKAKGRG